VCVVVGVGGHGGLSIEASVTSVTAGRRFYSKLEENNRVRFPQIQTNQAGLDDRAQGRTTGDYEINRLPLAGKRSIAFDCASNLT
jgi:hypothetical protein